MLPLQARIEAVADDADLEDVYNTERHLLYVACTRARDVLMVSGVKPASEFLDDLNYRALSNADQNSFDLIESDFVFRPVVEFRRPRRLVGRDGLSILHRAAAFQIGGDSGSSESVIARFLGQTGRRVLCA